MKHALLAFLLALYPAVAHAQAENPGPHRVKQTQISCQNTADYDDFQMAINNRKNPADQAEGMAKIKLLFDHENPKHQGRYCLTLKAGTMVTVEKRYGRYECVRFKGMPVGPQPYHNKCYWARNISDSYKDVHVPGIDLEWVY